MASLASAEIEQLRARIAALESRPPLGAGSWAQAVATGEAAPDILGGLLAPPRGLLHEVFAPGRREAGAALGFALGIARSLVSPARPALLHLELATDLGELGLPYAPGLAGFGLGPEQVILCRLQSLGDLLWAMEEALGCPAVAAVVADLPGAHRELDFTASRRLALRGAATGVSALLVRYGEGREASAARLRWRAGPAPSAAPAFDPRAPGSPRFEVVLEKSRLGAAAQRLEGRRFVLDWVDHGFALVERGSAADAGQRRPAVSRAQPAALGDRLSQAG